jgi:arylsulfatase A-like enzyme
MTGKLTSSHGARLDPAGPVSLANGIEGPWEKWRVRGVSPEERTLAVVLRERGYATAAVVAGPWLKRFVGLDLGFDRYDDEGIEALDGRRAPEVTDAALAWLDERPQDKPFFLFLNYFDPHTPYRPPPEFLGPPPAFPGDRQQRRLASSHWRYDGEIRFMDHALGRFLDELRARGLFDDTWIVVTADHGENLGEHAVWGHGRGLEQPVLRIPLIVKDPGGEHGPGLSNQPAQLSDIFPTILARLGIEMPPGIQGEPLGRITHPVVAEVYPLPFMGGYDGPVRALIEGRYKLIAKDRDRTVLYDLVDDPFTSRSLTDEQAERARGMRTALEGYLAGLPAPLPHGDAQTIDAETQEALRDLGYLE